MKKEKAKNNKEGLVKDLDAKMLALRDLRFGGAHSKNKNVKQQKTIKKEIARIKTALNVKVAN
jgi:ribosomal protein L29